jgi:coenzyme F420 hydrogenase subunit beta
VSYSQLRATVIDSDLCTRCGACEPACPEQIIRMVELLPALVSPTADERCGTCSDCLSVCPGASPHTPESEDVLFGRRRTPKEYWLGIYQDVITCWATDKEVYDASGSGGSVSALLAHALERLGFDWVLVCGREAERPYRASPIVCREPRAVHRYAQSTYQLSAYLAPLRSILDAEDGSRGAVAGLACHMQAVRALQRLDSPIGRRARERIGFLIEIACSSNTLPSGTETLITRDLGLRLDDVANVFYRDGEPYPGMFTVVTKDGERHRLPLFQAIRHFKEHKTHRCLSCSDWLSGLADISVIDGDPNIFIASVNGASEFQKNGTLLVRTPAGRAILQSAIRAGAVRAEPSALRTDGNLGLERKRSRRIYYEGLGKPISAGPVPGHVETGESLDDEALLTITDRAQSLRRRS